MFPFAVVVHLFIALVVFLNQFPGQLRIVDVELQANHTDTQTTLRVYFFLKWIIVVQRREPQSNRACSILKRNERTHGLRTYTRPIPVYCSKCTEKLQSKPDEN